MEMKFLNYNYNDNIIDLKIESGNIVGITGTDKYLIMDLLSLTVTGKGQLTVDGEKITKENIYKYRKKISLIPENLKIYTFIITVKDLMYYTINQNNLIIRDQEKKIKDSLKIIGMEETALDRKLIDLSSSEKKLIQLAISLLSNPEIIIMDEPFKSLDMKNEKKIYMLLQRLKEQFQKTIIIVSNDSNILYNYTNNMFFFKKNAVFLEGPTNEVYLRVDYLKKNKFEIPDIVEFTYLAKKKKQVKIDYHKDIRDIIKDIYKHV